MKSQIKLFIFIFILILLFILSCASTGKNFDLNKVEEIKKKISTKKDILNLFGLPMSAINVIEYNNKYEIWSYKYTNALGSTKSLSIKFDETGLVIDYGRIAK